MRIIFCRNYDLCEKMIVLIFYTQHTDFLGIAKYILLSLHPKEMIKCSKCTGSESVKSNKLMVAYFTPSIYATMSNIRLE